MKRNAPVEEGGEEPEEAEMDVDDEEKDDPDEAGDEVGDEEAQADEGLPRNVSSSTAFLDTFYGLSSSDPRERANAAQEMINYCLIGTGANVKDASYAFRRLLGGLCSGRAAARQGNAAALATFVKVAYQQGTLKEIRQESGENVDEPDLVYVRRRLIAATEPGEVLHGKRKGSESRDYMFGRLFGILGIVRSGALLPVGDNRPELTEVLDVASAFVEDLADLYSFKKWMREPAAHAIGTLLNSFYALCNAEKDAVAVVDRVVESVVVPRLLMHGDLASIESSVSTLYASYSAEQVALALMVQGNASLHSIQMPEPISQPILSKESIPLIANALSETSSVTQPRTHLVWDVLCSFVSEPDDQSSSSTTQVRRLKSKCPVGDESVRDILDLLIRHVVLERLLGVDAGSKAETKTTHERSSLAICLVRNLSGIEFVSSLTGRTKLLLPDDITESVIFNAPVVSHVFLRILGSGPKKQASHLLRPLADQVLRMISDVVHDECSSLGVSEQVSRRLSVLRPFLAVDPRFASKTKTDFIDRLLDVEGDAREPFDQEYRLFLEKMIASAGSENVAPYEAQGYIDLLFHHAKKSVREAVGESGQVRSHEIERTLLFLMGIAFFDCDQVSSEQQSGKSKKKKAQKTPAVAVASSIHGYRSTLKAAVPYAVRSVASSRFFSLVAERLLAITHSIIDDREIVALRFVTNLIEVKEAFEKAGATPIEPVGGNIEVAGDSQVSIREVVNRMQKLVDPNADFSDDVLRAYQKRKVALALLVSTLYLHLFRCGRPEDAIEDDDPDADDDADSEEIIEFIAGAMEVSDLYGAEDTSEDETLANLASLCADILSSPIALGNQSHGASPKLLREVVRLAWTGGLVSAAASKKTELDPGVLPVLLSSIGASESYNETNPEDVSDEEGEASDADDSSDEDEGEAIFAQAANEARLLEDEEMQEGADGDEEQGEVEIDPTNLHSFLEDSDEELEERDLEHHEGADAALARLIQIKQDARKAGKLARERVLLSQQLRCSLLLEVLLLGKEDGWGALLKTEDLLRMILPILRYRNDLERSLTHQSTQKSHEPGVNEKRSLMDKLTTLLKTKICKAKHLSQRWKQPEEAIEVASQLAHDVMSELKGRASKDHQACCSQALIAIIRSVPENGDTSKVYAVYQESVAEWSSKRTTRLQSSVFEDLITQCLPIAQVALTLSLAEAAVSARSPFLRSESFRMLSLLYSHKTSVESKLDLSACRLLSSSRDKVLGSCICALKDAEMKKAKRAREVMKTAEKVIVYLASSPNCEAVKSSDQGEFVACVESLKTESESQGLVAACDKVLKLLDLSPEQGTSNQGEKEGTDKEMGGAKRSSKKKKKKAKKQKR